MPRQGCISSVSYIKPQRSDDLLSAPACCISSVSYIKPQQHFELHGQNYGCISSVSYIKPQLCVTRSQRNGVVYRPFPTSNHNCSLSHFYVQWLYIVRFLHQTTTVCVRRAAPGGCISSVSYIKPQHCPYTYFFILVVYRPFPTSNHNVLGVPTLLNRLYIVRFLHQTTTHKPYSADFGKLYIVRFLHQTTTVFRGYRYFVALYIVRFLHQTTTLRPSLLHHP